MTPYDRLADRLAILRGRLATPGSQPLSVLLDDLVSTYSALAAVADLHRPGRARLCSQCQRCEQCGQTPEGARVEPCQTVRTVDHVLSIVVPNGPSGSGS